MTEERNYLLHLNVILIALDVRVTCVTYVFGFVA